MTAELLMILYYNSIVWDYVQGHINSYVHYGEMCGDRTNKTPCNKPSPRELKHFRLGNPKIIFRWHDDGIRQRAGVESNPCVALDGSINVEGERKNGLAERWDGAGNESGKLEKFFGIGEAELLRVEMRFDLL